MGCRKPRAMDGSQTVIAPATFLQRIPLFRNALCADIKDPDLFFPDGKVEEAKRLPELRRICGACTERKECLEYAIREEIPYGFFGGKTPLERGQDRQRSQRSIRAERIVKLRSKGVSAEDIATLMHLKVTYVYRIFTEANQARKREDQSNPKTSTQSDDSSSPLGSAQ
jgi:WhiB family transcriptional regulator, redox-sensing transcriptional regulator